MVESPTFYRAFQPVLKTLQGLETDEMSFKEELVESAEGPLPTFLDSYNSFDASIAYKNLQNGERITLQEFFVTPHSRNSVFDPSQEKAVKKVLQNRIGIIQGPPGCGKSFIGMSVFVLLVCLYRHTFLHIENICEGERCCLQNQLFLFLLKLFSVERGIIYN